MPFTFHKFPSIFEIPGCDNFHVQNQRYASKITNWYYTVMMRGLMVSVFVSWLRESIHERKIHFIHLTYKCKTFLLETENIVFPKLWLPRRAHLSVDKLEKKTRISKLFIPVSMRFNVRPLVLLSVLPRVLHTISENTKDIKNNNLCSNSPMSFAFRMLKCPTEKHNDLL